MGLVLFDGERDWTNLLPLTFTRPVAGIRVGILTIAEKWERWLGERCTYDSREYLREKFPGPARKAHLFVNATFLPGEELVSAVRKLRKGQVLFSGEEAIAWHGDRGSWSEASVKRVAFKGPALRIQRPWDIFLRNGEAIRDDFEVITRNRLSLPISRSVTVIGKKARIFIEAGARAEACILNSTEGPIYLDKHSEIMEGCAVRGPFALGEHAVLKMNAKVYGPTTIGPHSKAGGEVSNSVIFGYSNKAHDGFLGNSVVGEWCNLGADTNTSNLKNNYANVKVYSYGDKKPLDSGLQFCGLFMGDHSKSGINTMFNTGTVVGVGCNVFGSEFPPTFVPDFSWGGASGFETYELAKLFETAERVFGRRKMKFDEKEKGVLRKVFEQRVC